MNLEEWRVLSGLSGETTGLDEANYDPERLRRMAADLGDTSYAPEYQRQVARGNSVVDRWKEGDTLVDPAFRKLLQKNFESTVRRLSKEQRARATKLAAEALRMQAKTVARVAEIISVHLHPRLSRSTSARLSQGVRNTVIAHVHYHGDIDISMRVSPADFDEIRRGRAEVELQLWGEHDHRGNPTLWNEELVFISDDPFDMGPLFKKILSSMPLLKKTAADLKAREAAAMEQMYGE